MAVTNRAYQYYNAEYNKDTQQNYRGYSLHNKAPFLAINSYCNNEQYYSQSRCGDLKNCWSLKGKICNNNTYYQQLEYVEKCFCYIFLLLFGKVHDYSQIQLYHNHGSMSRTGTRGSLEPGPRLTSHFNITM